MKMIVKLLACVIVICSGVIYASDPTRPDVLKQSPKAKTMVTQLKLTMIQRSKSGGLAVINGQALEIGHYIGGYRLASIGNDHVILKNNKGQVRLSLITRGTLKKS